MKCGRTGAALKRAEQRGRRALALELVGEQILGGDDLALHADDLGDLGDAAHAVAHAADLHDQVHGGGDLGAHRLGAAG